MFAEGIKGFEGGITTRKYQAVTKCSRATAFRDLNEMLKAGILVKRPGAGRNVSHDLVSVEASLPPVTASLLGVLDDHEIDVSSYRKHLRG